MTLEEQVAAYDPNLSVVWTGTLYGCSLDPAVIVEDRTTKRRYLWPRFTAWREPLPSDPPLSKPVEKKPLEQMSLWT